MAYTTEYNIINTKSIKDTFTVESIEPEPDSRGKICKPGPKCNGASILCIRIVSDLENVITYYR